MAQSDGTMICTVAATELSKDQQRGQQRGQALPIDIKSILASFWIT